MHTEEETTSGEDTSSPEQPPSPIQKESKKLDGFICPKYPRKDRIEAHARILKGPDKVDNAVHSNPQSKRDTATFFVGNIEYNAREQDLRTALDPKFQRVRVEKITIPRVNG